MAYIQYGLLAYLAFIFSVSLAKISMLVLYLRITPHRWFHWICYTCIAVVAGYSIAAALVESLACKPLQGIVDESLDAECYNSYPAYIALSSLRYEKLFTDFLFCSEIRDLNEPTYPLYR